MSLSFHSIYTHGFIRAAVCVPRVRVADTEHNLEQTLSLARRASEERAAVAIFPELGLSAYSNDDLFQQEALLDATIEALDSLVRQTASLTPVLVVGAPLRVEGKLFNCGIVIYRGKILGIAPKSYLPNYREFYEKRQFVSARDALTREVVLFGQKIPFGADLVFEAASIPGFSLNVEICEDLWTPLPPSTIAALAGATVLANLSASNVTIGKADYRRRLCAGQSARCVAAYLYAGAGFGESTTDLAWDGHGLIFENDEMLAETTRFSDREEMIVADIDMERLRQERMRVTSFADCAAAFADRARAIRKIAFDFEIPPGDTDFKRVISRFPYAPSHEALLDQRCAEVYEIQVHAVAKRLASARLERLVIGVSGGLDSTQALIVAARVMDRIGLPRAHVMAYTMPGFATSEWTLENARRLMKALGVSAHELDIRPACAQMFRDIGHPYADGQPVYDLTFENVQAGERTSHLFRLANRHHALVLGTGDLSELALGWMTYGVGDHMSHYNPNVSAPKTLIQQVIHWAASTGQFDPAASAVLRAILDTEISPELIPHAADDKARPAQKTAAVIGPYELQDFNLYYVTRYGFRPSKVAYLAFQAWGNKERGSWPPLYPPEKREAYSLREIKKWLAVFLERFFGKSQFKRSAIPNGPKLGSGGSLSPRGDWRAPSDSESVVWLRELRERTPDE